jgi:HEAT repeat protein
MKPRAWRLALTVALLVAATAAMAAETTPTTNNPPAASTPPAGSAPSVRSAAGSSASGGFAGVESAVDFGGVSGLGSFGDSSFGRTTGGSGTGGSSTSGTQNARPVSLPGVLGVTPTRFARDARGLLAQTAAGGAKPVKPADPAEVKRLAAETAGNDDKTRESARQRLAELGESAVQPLIDTLRDAKAAPAERQAAQTALMAVGRPAVTGLIKIVDDGDPQVRAAAADTLGAIGDRAATRPLVRVLADKDLAVRSRVAAALGALRDPESAPALTDVFRKDESLDVRAAAATALARLGCRASVEPLLEGLQTEPPQMRLASAKALAIMGEMLASGVRGEICRARTGEALMTTLKDKDPAVRLAAVEALGALKDQRAVDPLVALLPDATVRMAAIKSISQIGTNHARRVLEQVADRAEEAPVRTAAREALGQMRTRG